MNPDVTFELTLGFDAASLDLSARLKRAALAWLKERGITDFIEGVIDGVDILVASDDPLTAFADETCDTTPVSVFDFDEARLDGLANAARAAFSQQGLTLRLSRLDTRSWSEAWEANYAGFETPAFIVRPIGAIKPDADPQKILIELAPGRAFGAGDHATTQACLESLGYLRQAGRLKPGGRCLDVGTGTGILGIAAAKCGFSHVLGTDIDATALKEAARNCAHNGVAMGLVCLDEPPAEAGLYDLIVANILVPVLHHLMPRLAAHLAPGGCLLLAGFIEKERAALEGTAAASGLTPFNACAVRGWVALALESS